MTDSLDRILAEGYLGDVSALDITDVRSRRAECKDIETGLSYLRRLVQGRRIPYIKWGHLLRFDPDEIETWISRHHVGALRPFIG